LPLSCGVKSFIMTIIKSWITRTLIVGVLVFASSSPCWAQTRPSSSTVITAKEFFQQLSNELANLPESASVRKDFEIFSWRHDLKSDEMLYSQYVKIKALFESTRDGGLWGLHWRITNREPDSTRIWRQWQNLKGDISLVRPTAIAECDEISALLAFLSKKMGIRGVGLFWPTWNHTIAVWFMKPNAKKEIRIMVPTTQIFLQESDYFGTDKFDPWRQKSVFEYRGEDIKDTSLLPKKLADFFIRQITKYAGASERTLQYLRYLRDSVFCNYLTPGEAAARARNAQATISGGAKQNIAAIQSFIDDMKE